MMAELAIQDLQVPLRIDPDGMVRVGSSQVGLTVVLAAYQGGDSAEEIPVRFPDLELAEVYAVLAYYLTNKDQVDRYLSAPYAQADTPSPLHETTASPAAPPATPPQAIELTTEEQSEGWRPIRIPIDLEKLGGDWIWGVASVDSAHSLLTQRTGRGVATIQRLDGDPDWLDEFVPVHFRTMSADQTLRAIRLADEQDFRRYRVPAWIQSEEIPTCCDRSMEFVGQLDDSHLCVEAPPGAKFWWHDAASFYVFTCSQCLEVQAVGQQY
jgi:uncharacterized protein (DUF433 family)